MAEAFYAFDDPPEATIFSVLAEIMRERAREERTCDGCIQMASKSYWSYGKVNHQDGALIPEGRVLIDTAKSFVYTEGKGR